MRGRDHRNALIAALSLAVLAGAACSRNNEEGVGQVGAQHTDSTMGHADSARMQTGRADTSYARPDTSMKRDTTTRNPTTSTSVNTPSDTSTRVRPPSNDPNSTTPNSTTTTPNSSTNPSSSSSNPSSSSTNPSSSTTTSTTTPQASGPSAAGYSYEPSVAAPWAAAAGAAQQQLTDANILAMLDQADMGDSAGGAVAMQKAASPQVKDYGRMMTRDHHQSRLKGQQLAKSLKITPQAASDNPVAAAVQKNSATLASTPKGEQFDRTYIDQEVAMHQQVIALAKQAAQTTKNEQLRQHIEQNSPVLQRHLQRAQEIQQSLGRMPT